MKELGLWRLKLVENLDEVCSLVKTDLTIIRRLCKVAAAIGGGFESSVMYVIPVRVLVLYDTVF